MPQLRSTPAKSLLDGLPIRRKRARKDASADGNPEYQRYEKKQKRILAAYPPQMQDQVSKLVSDILASIYYDINYVCILRGNVRLDPTAETVAQYRLQFRESSDLLDRVVGRFINRDTDTNLHDGSGPKFYFDPRGTIRRLEEFVTIFGWKMLTICMTAEGFRRACREIRHSVIWAEFLEKMRENQWSIEVFARSRNLDWRGQLLKYAHLELIPELDSELRPVRKMWGQHPHHVVQTLDKKVRRPMFEGTPQAHIDESVFDPRNWEEDGRLEDPTTRIPHDGDCDLCGSKDICDCVLDFSAGSLIELVDRPLTGTGVRALTSFKKGDILGQFVGELHHPDYDGDHVYSLMHASKTDPEYFLAIISPRKYGNWTRYIAHSCRASTKFNYRTVGRRTVMTVEARRDIAPFEDLTINYGSDYWAHRECMCGEANCVSRQRSRQ